MPHTSTRRLLGSVLFGLIVSDTLFKAVDFTFPVIVSIVQHMSIEEARTLVYSWPAFNLIFPIPIVFVSGVMAAFLARRRGVWISLAANSILISISGAVLFFLAAKNINYPIGSFSYRQLLMLQVVIYASTALLAGWVGERSYSLSIDPDREQPRPTIFGIYWAHYLWMFPLVFYPFVTTFLMVVYGGFLVYLAAFRHLAAPATWSPHTWGYFLILPSLIGVAGWLGWRGVIRFMESMRFTNQGPPIWKKIGAVLIFGVGAPAVAYAVAVVSALLTDQMPAATGGSEPLAIGVLLALCGAVLVLSFGSSLKQSRI